MQSLLCDLGQVKGNYPFLHRVLLLYFRYKTHDNTFPLEIGAKFGLISFLPEINWQNRQLYFVNALFTGGFSLYFGK